MISPTHHKSFSKEDFCFSEVVLIRSICPSFSIGKGFAVVGEAVVSRFRFFAMISWYLACDFSRASRASGIPLDTLM